MIGRVLYFASVGLCVLGVATIYAQSEGLVVFPSARLPRLPAVFTAAGGPESHYAPGEDLERIDVGLIDDAGESIDIAAYVLTNVPVIEALTDAAERGVKIRLFRFPSSYDDSGRVADALGALERAPGVIERFKKGSELMHLKSYCVDGQLLRAGAANFSTSGLKRQDNDLWILRGAGVCSRFEKAFEAMWSQ